MNAQSFRSFIKDLIEVLPEEPVEWSEIETIDPNKHTVVLISGFAASQRKVSVIRRRLLRDGCDVVVLSLACEKPWDLVGGLYRMAEKLSRVVLQVHKKNGSHRGHIFLVAHSAGGLVARYYVQYLGGDHYCNALITLATPHRGTWIASLGFFTHLILKAACLFQILPISKFMRRLNQNEIPEGFKMVSIFSRGDKICPSGGTLKGASVTEIPNISHSEFLLSKKSYEALFRMIELNTNQQYPLPHPLQAHSR